MTGDFEPADTDETDDGGSGSDDPGEPGGVAGPYPIP